MAESVSQDLCLVDKILDKRIDVDTGEVEYLIRWLGADRDGNDFEDSWEPDYNVFGEELIEEFERMRVAKRLQHRTHKASRLTAALPDVAQQSSPRIDDYDRVDDFFESRKNQIPPRFYPPQVPTALSSYFASEAKSLDGGRGHQQVPSLPAPHSFDGRVAYPIMARPPRTRAPLPSYPESSRSAFSRPVPGPPSSNMSSLESTDAMTVDGPDESGPHGEKRKRVSEDCIHTT